MKRILIIMAVAIFSQAAFAKEMANRLGIGFKDQYSVSLPSAAVQYYPTSELGLSAALGVDTQKDNSKFGMMARVYRIVFTEENLNFYMGAGGGILSHETAGKNDSGFELAGFAGAEFFFSGLENLGFSFEAGVGVASLSSGSRFRTFGDTPVRAGIMFYL